MDNKISRFVMVFAPPVRDLPAVSSLRSVGFAELAGVYPAKRGLGSSPCSSTFAPAPKTNT
jgi:hypothetical protein